MLAQGATVMTAVNPFHRFRHGACQAPAARPVAFEQMKGHALCRFRPDRRKATQVINELIQKGTLCHFIVPWNERVGDRQRNCAAIDVARHNK